MSNELVVASEVLPVVTSVEVTVLADNFVEVETREHEDSDQDNSSFYFKCKCCQVVAMATNGSIFVKDPAIPAAEYKSVFINYLYCWKCDTLENMELKVCESEVIILNLPMPPDGSETVFNKRIRNNIFS